MRILATSREPLMVPGEQVHPVMPLSVPAEDDPDECLAENEAVQLFVQRARARTARFELTPETSALTASICRAVGGVPLAIELAARRTATMTLPEIVRRLDDPLTLLDGSGRAAPARHQSLRASLDWSHDLLSEPEQRLLRRLAVFGNGFTLETAAALCGDRQLPSVDVAPWLERLVAQSPVLTEEHAGVTRFRLTPMVRLYGLARLEQADELTPLQERYRALVCGRARACATLAARAARGGRRGARGVVPWRVPGAVGGHARAAPDGAIRRAGGAGGAPAPPQPSIRARARRGDPGCQPPQQS